MLYCFEKQCTMTGDFRKFVHPFLHSISKPFVWKTKIS
uniref:Uncharacterized protein n=1 Tax=Arundo donax TaxID=35708 RepID=A0A0A9HIN1_ARUDO